MPAVSLALNASTTLAGYWSDGTADVEVAVSLRNKGSLRLDDAQRVVLTCIPDQDVSDGCHGGESLSLEDGFGPASAQFVLRLPIGKTALEIDYGGDEAFALDVDVPERILGVERDVWECYSDRPPEPVANAFQDDNDGCGGWATETVEKWLNDVPVKVWAAGDERYVEVFREVTDELSPILDLQFQWVDAESKADFKAFVGISRSARAEYGFDIGYDYYVDYAGFGGANSRNGEALSGHVVVWLRDSDEWEARDRNGVKHTIMHEVLHAMAPIGHSTRIGSVMSYSASLKKLSPMDESLIRLNSYRLVQPGMTMAEVEALIVFREDLLDAPPPPELDTHQMVWRATIALWEAGSARFKIRGGWLERRCGLTFGVRRGLATLEIGNFAWLPNGAYLARFDDQVNTFWILYSRSDRKRYYWSEEEDGLQAVGADHVDDATAWWTSTFRFTRALGSLLNDADADDITIVARSNGTITLEATLDESYPTFWLESAETVDLTLVLDDETYQMKGYSYNYWSPPTPGTCDVYEEVAEEVELGVQIDVPPGIKLNTFK